MRSRRVLQRSAFVSALVLGLGCSGVETGNAGGSIVVQISGEQAAVDGMPFPATGEVALRDGWALSFDHVLVTVGDVTLSENPDKSPTDPSRTDEVVARVAGPWAVDLHRPGSVPAAGGEGTAVPLVTIDGQTEKGGASFAADRRYAFAYRVVEASASAARLNFAGDAEAEAAYGEMVAKGYSVLYMGTATWKGEACATSDASYDYASFPKAVRFRLGFKSPTQYVNCQNQDNQGDPFPDESYQRGIAVRGGAPTIAQITLHLEHPFFSDVHHDPALFFDPIAARVVGAKADAVVTMDDLVGVDPTGFTDAAGKALPWRSCDGSTPPAFKQMGFEVGSVPVNPTADPSVALRDYRDFVHYVQSTQGHLNGGDGLCFVERLYPSPR